MKRFTLLMFSLLTVMSVMAVPARPNQWRTLALVDGTTVKALLVGDEYAHCYRAVDGSVYVSAGNGLYKKADRQEVANRSAKRRSKAASRLRNRLKVALSGDRGNYQGVQKGLIILVNYSDVKFGSGHDQALYTRIANELNFSQDNFKGSVKDYFLAQSSGKFAIDFDVVGPVTMPKTASYYGSNNSDGDDQHAEEMVAEACRQADSQVNFADYDWDGDGEVDQVYVIYAGKGEADGGAANTIWPHASALSAAGQDLTLDGVAIDSYACSAELSSSGIDGIGTICHEFSHCLGYPDMYDIFYEGNYGMGSWDLMNSGSYNDDGFTPAGYTCYEKWIAGWIDYVELDGEDVQVRNLKPTSEGGDAYVIYNKGNRNEYFLIENRQQTGWDSGLPASGLSVIHVDYHLYSWLDNVVNSLGEFTTAYGWSANWENDHQRFTIVHADNDDDSKYWNSTWQYYEQTTEEGDLYPYGGNNCLSDTSVPNFNLYNSNNDGTRNLGVKIDGIAQNSDGTVDFDYKATVAADPTVPGAQVFYESFDKCAGTGGNDGKWSGSVAQGKFNPDMQGWSGASVSGGKQCAKSGSSSKSGTLTSPSFVLTGKGILTCKVAPFGTDGGSLEVKYNNVTVGKFTMASNKWTDITVSLTGAGTGTLTFVPAKRFFIDEVKVVADEGSSTGIALPDAPVSPITDNRIYTIQGQFVGTDLSALPAGIYIVNGKKIIK